MSQNVGDQIPSDAASRVGKRRCEIFDYLKVACTTFLFNNGAFLMHVCVCKLCDMELSGV